jgi:hypothetical protein
MQGLLAVHSKDQAFINVLQVCMCWPYLPLLILVRALLFFNTYFQEERDKAVRELEAEQQLSYLLQNQVGLGVHDAACIWTVCRNKCHQLFKLFEVLMIYSSFGAGYIAGKGSAATRGQ